MEKKDRVPHFVLVLLVGWFVAFSLLAFYPWFSEGLFWDFAGRVSVGQSMASIRDEVHASRMLRFDLEQTVEMGVSTNCILCVGSVDPPRRLYLLTHNAVVLAKAPEVADFTISDKSTQWRDIQGFRWTKSYIRYVFRSLACCAAVYSVCLVCLRSRRIFLRILALLIGGVSFVIILVDVLWLALVYVRYAVLLMMGVVGC